MATVRLFKHHIHTAFYFLAVIECCLFLGAFYLGAYYYFYIGGESVGDHLGNLLPQAATFAAVGMASLATMGLYKPQLREGAPGTLLRLMGAFIAIILAMAVVFYVVPDLYLWRGIFAQTVLFAFMLCVLSRILFSRLVNAEELKSRVLVLGAGQRAKTMTDSLRRASDRRGFRFVGFVPCNGETIYIANEKILRPDGDLAAFVRRQQIDQIVVTPDERRGGLPVDDLLECRLNGVKVLEVADFFEREAGKIMLDFLSPGWLTFSEGFSGTGFSSFTKRTFDIIAALCLLLVAWPLMMITFIAIWLEDGFGAPIVYTQERVGARGEVFKVLKLRSMSVDAEGDGQARWAAKGDSRVTRVGSIIRRLRIDELPQILNVLNGDMSLVGPRPERPEFVEELAANIPYYRARHYVKPGIAGWAQLNYPYGANENDARQKLQYDLYYVKNNSLFLDFMILLTTVEVVLFGNGVR